MTETELLEIIERAARDQVTYLDLSENRLSALPGEIGQLHNLTVLYLIRNQLSALPAEIGQLHNLTQLILRENRLSALPGEIGQLHNLTVLDLRDNQLSALPGEIGQLHNLTVLDLRDNRLSALPGEIGQLHNLTVLNLSRNQLSALPGEIWQLHNLTVLSLSRNQLSALPGEIGQLHNLTRLYLRENQLSALPGEIWQLHNLTVLNLSRNQLSALPGEIWQLHNLTELDLSRNQLSALPGEIGQLHNLTRLYLIENQLSALPGEIGQLHNLTVLDLSGNQLSALPGEIGQLHNLTRLDLSGNQLSALPGEVGQLHNLTRLDLSRNQLSALPGEIGQLHNLTELYLNDNQLSALPGEIGQLDKLTKLDLRDNQLSALPGEIWQLDKLTKLHLSDDLRPWDDGLHLRGNPLTSPPPEILSQGIAAVFAYLKEQQQQRQWIGKLVIVGEGGTGKTSLLRALLGEPFNIEESTTHGIAIRSLNLAHPQEANITMQLNAWDFGGQDIYHATQQFFLTNRSLFVLVWNARLGYQQGRLDYWLDKIKSLAPDSPITLVATHIDERGTDLPLQDYRQRYPQIVGQWEISNKTGAGLANLQQALADTAAKLPLMGENWPATWLKAANIIRHLPEKYTTPEKLQEIAAGQGVAADGIEVLARWLHELGEILYFVDNDRLNDIVILQPQWVTQYISKVLDSEEVTQNSGIFTRATMRQLWADLDPTMRDRFLQLMEQFNLSYPIPDDGNTSHKDASLVVELLPLDLPNYQPVWEAIKTRGNCYEMTMRWQLNTIPAGIPTWVIARSHRFSINIHWRNGALFADNSDRHHLALIQAFPQRRCLQLTVRGATPQNFFALLKDGIELNLAKFPGLEIERKIPCSCQVLSNQSCKHLFNYANLEKALQRQPPIIQMQCPESFNPVSVIGLLSGFYFDHPSSNNYQNLAFNTVIQKLEEIKTQQQQGQTQVLEGQDQIIKDQANLIELAQREFIKLFRHKNTRIDRSCPHIFALEPIDAKWWQKNIGTQKFKLQLYCEEPRCSHPACNGGLYEVAIPTELLTTMAPYLRRLVSILQLATAIPFVGAALGISSAEAYQKAIQKDLASMQAIAQHLTTPENTPNRNIPPDEESNLIQLEGAALRVLEQLLREKDPYNHWGGLDLVETPEGHFLWVCEEHAQKYKA